MRAWMLITRGSRDSTEAYGATSLICRSCDASPCRYRKVLVCHDLLGISAARRIYMDVIAWLKISWSCP